MSYADLIVSGTIHQAHRRFSDVTRGKQCASTMPIEATMLNQTPIWNNKETMRFYKVAVSVEIRIIGHAKRSNALS